MVLVDALLRKNFKPVDKRDALQNVLGWLTGDTNVVPIVMDGPAPFGIVNERALMSRKLEHKAHIGHYALATRSVPQTATTQTAAERMSEFRAGYLPVHDAKERLTGYVTALDVTRDADLHKTARDLAQPVGSLQEKETLGDALHRFTQEYVPYIPVVNDGHYVGILPRRHIVRLAMNAGDKGRTDNRGEKINALTQSIGGFMEAADSAVRPNASTSAVLDAVEKRGYAIVMERDGPVLGLITPETLVWGVGRAE